MAFLIRPIGEADYIPAAALCNAIDADRSEQADTWRRADERAAENRGVHRYVVIANGLPQLAGYGAIWRVHLRKYRIDLLIDPAWRRLGAGGMLLAHLLGAARELGAETVQARANAAAAESLAFLRKRGFAETQRMQHLSLAVADANLAPFQLLEQGLADQGITITTFAHERERDPTYLQKLHDLQNAVLPDWPDPDPGPFTPIAFEAFVRRFAQPTFLADALYIARSRDIYVGYSGLERDTEAPERLISCGTAVRPAQRLHGVATALKVRTIDYAQRCSATNILTATANPAMLAVNRKLGFRPRRVEVRLVLTCA
jgi:GNAT superfamily N-acetyltransferase